MSRSRTLRGCCLMTLRHGAPYEPAPGSSIAEAPNTAERSWTTFQTAAPLTVDDGVCASLRLRFVSLLSVHMVFPPSSTSIRLCSSGGGLGGSTSGLSTMKSSWLITRTNYNNYMCNYSVIFVNAVLRSTPRSGGIRPGECIALC